MSLTESEQRTEHLALIISSLENECPALPIESNQLTGLDWALMFEATPFRYREEFWALINVDMQASVLSELRSDVRESILKTLSAKQLMRLAENSTSDEIIDYIDYLPEKIVKGILRRLTAVEREQVETAMQYEDSAIGRYMSYDALVVLSTASVADVIIDLKNVDEKYHSDKVYVVDNKDVLMGIINMSHFATLPKKSKIIQYVDQDMAAINIDCEPFEAISILKGSGESHLPVIDLDGKLQGIFSLYEALALTQSNYEEQVSHMGQVSDEDLFAPILKSSKSRAVWLGINLITAIVAAAVISLFEATIAEVVALAVLMPIVASMGGIAGSQTLTLTIRGLATGQLSSINTSELGKKEFMVSVINGILWALVVAATCFAWLQNISLAVIIATAILLNMIIAAFSGVLIPVLLDKKGIDPALAGSVILTTVTDVSGFFIFLGLATIIMI